MASKQFEEFLDATEYRDIRDDLYFAVDLLPEPGTAVDCGCGAGADIEYLVSKGFRVHGFDIEEASITRCMKRFAGNNNVELSMSGFGSYQFPQVSLVVADSSLFFCPPNEFELVWSRIYDCLVPGGIFCGSFLGPEDSMAQPGFDRSSFWSEILVLDEKQVSGLFDNFEICRFTEHKRKGKTVLGESHNWHIYSVVARKKTPSVC